MTIQTGVAAPDFTLAAHNTDQKISLASFRGRLYVCGRHIAAARNG